MDAPQRDRPPCKFRSLPSRVPLDKFFGASEGATGRCPLSSQAWTDDPAERGQGDPFGPTPPPHLISATYGP
jgi:hypothetical protein